MFERLRQPVTFKRPRRDLEASGDDQTPSLDDTLTEPTGAEAGEAVLAPQVADPPAPARSSRRARSVRGGRGRDATLVGLAIEPGLLVAAKSRLNGHVVVERAAFQPIGMDVVRDGEVNDVPALVEGLSELFRSSKLDRRVRIGIANQRIMMRRIELPPLTDPSEIQQAVLFQAQDEIPMPLESVVLDHYSLGLDEGPSGQRLQVLLVAARRDMVERVLQAARLAGLQPEGIDLAAFGMIRALRPADAGPAEHILYLAIGGLTNLAISRGPICEFTRVIPWGVEQIAGDIAARCGVPIEAARRLLAENSGELTEPPAAAQPASPLAGFGQPLAGFSRGEQSLSAAADPEPSFASAPSPSPPPDLSATSFGGQLPPASIPPPAAPVDPNDLLAGPPAPTIDQAQVVRTALTDGIRRIAAEVRHSLDFYLAGQTESPVTRALLCGPALDVPGFMPGLARELGIVVARGEVALASPTAAGDVPPGLLPVAAGLSVPDGAA